MFRRALLSFVILQSLLGAGSARLWGAAQPNVVLVTLDSTRADRMGFLGSSSGLTPNLDRLAHQGIVFERAYAQAPLTVVSQATILTGTYPQTHQASELAFPLAATLPYLPDLLHTRHYHTAAFVGSITLDTKTGSAPGFDRGFDQYDGGFQRGVPGAAPAGPWKRTGQQVTARAITWLSSQSGPVFLWVHLSDAQAPYPSTYDRGIAAADAAVGKLIAALRTAKLYDDSIIVVAADHGESLGAHGEDLHGIFLYDETIQVPLLVRLPQNQMAGKRVKGRVRLLDVAPTVLEAAGIPVPSQMQGQSLLRIARTNPAADQPVYSRSDLPQQAFGWSPLESWRAGKYLYIRAPKAELYDLSADPHASRNLAEVSKATLETMGAQLAAFDAHFTSEGLKSGGGLSSSEMQKLSSLGYVGLQKTSTGVSTAASGADPKDAIGGANAILKAVLSLSPTQGAQTISLLQAALAKQPNSYLAEYALGMALARGQQYAAAIGHLHRAIELQPNSAWAHYEMGASLIKTGDFKTAAVHLDLASARLPRSREAHLLLAQCYERLGKAKEAQAERAKVSP
jgi:arylsulfatase A-like enzyme